MGRARPSTVLGAGTGLRNGERLGLTLDRVDFLRRTLLIDRQLVTVANQAPAFGPPKTAGSVRSIPLPTVVGEELARHVKDHGTGPDGLLFVSPGRRPVTRTLFGHMWRPVVPAAKAPAGTRYHDLRHHYASLHIRHGGSVKTVRPGSDTRPQPRLWTPTPTCGRTATTGPGTRCRLPSAQLSRLLRTTCGLTW